jgi:hypothetical protein
MDRADPVPKEEEATTAMDVYATLCAQVMTKSTTASAWAKFSAVLLDPETEAFFKARIQEGDDDPPSKKQKQTDCDRNPPTVCAHCGGNVPKIALRVACVDGTTLDVVAAQCGVVRDIKDTVGQVCVCAWARICGTIAGAVVLNWLAFRFVAKIRTCWSFF